MDRHWPRCCCLTAVTVMMLFTLFLCHSDDGHMVHRARSQVSAEWSVLPVLRSSLCVLVAPQHEHYIAKPRAIGMVLEGRRSAVGDMAHIQHHVEGMVCGVCHEGHGFGGNIQIIGRLDCI